MGADSMDSDEEDEEPARDGPHLPLSQPLRHRHQSETIWRFLEYQCRRLCYGIGQCHRGIFQGTFFDTEGEKIRRQHEEEQPIPCEMAKAEGYPNNSEKVAGEPLCNSSGQSKQQGASMFAVPSTSTGNNIGPAGPKSLWCIIQHHSKQHVSSELIWCFSEFLSRPPDTSDGVWCCSCCHPQAVHSNRQALMAPVATTPIPTTPIVAAMTSTPKRKAIDSGNPENAAKKTLMASTTMNAPCPRGSQANFLAQAAGLEATNALHVKRSWEMEEGSSSLLFQETQNRRFVVEHEKINGRGDGTCCYLPRDSNNISHYGANGE
ncbi:hypothetical protein TrVFT333_009491 [Trichoderma virens FT-333]|nr:hypothetical protein TrVFT333_009491 [Trichoderma virens FT-333]